MDQATQATEAVEEGNAAPDQISWHRRRVELVAATQPQDAPVRDEPQDVVEVVELVLQNRVKRPLPLADRAVPRFREAEINRLVALAPDQYGNDSPRRLRPQRYTRRPPGGRVLDRGSSAGDSLPTGGGKPLPGFRDCLND